MNEYLLEITSAPEDSEEVDYQRRYRKMKANKKRKRRKDIYEGYIPEEV